MRTRPLHERRRDRGTTFVEILVSIVLLGTAVGGTLTALRTTIVSSKVDGDVTKASVWLREAEEALHRTAYKQCSVNTELRDRERVSRRDPGGPASRRVGGGDDQPRLGPVLGTERDDSRRRVDARLHW